ncbi:MAG TPA: hypothetical protein VNC16_00200 [Solirubrobacterales bacterium]|nr:hypothetical protein [Solirubrobacterales bacterium]
MRMRGTAVAVLALAALSCFPGGAWAKAGDDRPPVRQWIDVELQGSNGYTIHLSVNPRRHLVLQVEKEGFLAEYMTRDLLPETDRVKAKLRGLGVISLRFHPRGSVRHPSLPRCEKWRPTVQPGVVRGTIKFVGERNYTRVKAREAEAAVEEPKKWTCRYGSPFEFNPREREWTSKFSARGEGFFFLARRYRPGLLKSGPVIFFVEQGEAFEAASGQAPLTIYRQLKLPAPAAAFDDSHPEHLTVSPPAPFSGTGALARTPESVFTWKGDLSIQFPGLDPIPLTEPSYGFDYCLREVGCFEQQVD